MCALRPLCTARRTRHTRRRASRQSAERHTGTGTPRWHEYDHRTHSAPVKALCVSECLGHARGSHSAHAGSTATGYRARQSSHYMDYGFVFNLQILVSGPYVGVVMYSSYYSYVLYMYISPTAVCATCVAVQIQKLFDHLILHLSRFEIAYNHWLRVRGFIHEPCLTISIILRLNEQWMHALQSLICTSTTVHLFYSWLMLIGLWEWGVALVELTYNCIENKSNFLHWRLNKAKLALDIQVVRVWVTCIWSARSAYEFRGETRSQVTDDVYRTDDKSTSVAGARRAVARRCRGSRPFVRSRTAARSRAHARGRPWRTRGRPPRATCPRSTGPRPCTAARRLPHGASAAASSPLRAHVNRWTSEKWKDERKTCDKRAVQMCSHVGYGTYRPEVWRWRRRRSQRATRRQTIRRTRSRRGQCIVCPSRATK